MSAPYIDFPLSMTTGYVKVCYNYLWYLIVSMGECETKDIAQSTFTNFSGEVSVVKLGLLFASTIATYRYDL